MLSAVLPLVQLMGVFALIAYVVAALLLPETKGSQLPEVAPDAE